MPLSDAPLVLTPNALGPTNVTLVTRLEPIELMRQKKNASGKLLYTDPKGKQTTASETVLKDPATDVPIRTYSHDPIMETVKDAGGKVVLDYVERVSINQTLVDDTKAQNEPGFQAGNRQGNENDLSDALKAKWAALVVETKAEFAAAIGMKAWPTVS